VEEKIEEKIEEKVEEKVEEKMGIASEEMEELISPETFVHTISPNMTIFDLYEVGHKTVTREISEDATEEIPFSHQIKILGLQGEIVSV
jgi:hypothetical protein